MATRRTTSGIRFVGTHPWPAITQDLMRPNQSPVIAVVAYVGQDAQAIMPLTKGDILICDASQPRVKAGAVSAPALVNYEREGVEVRSLPGLHAKVISGGTYAWVGSANASMTSSDALCEASVRVTQAQAAVIRHWAEDRLAESALLTRRDLAALAKIEVVRTPLGPKYKSTLTVPSDLKSLWFIVLSQPTSKGIAAAAEKETRSVASLVGSGGAKLQWFENTTGVPPDFKAGQWLAMHWFPQLHYKATPPAEVVHVSDHGKSKIVWVKTAKVPYRPAIRDLPGDLPAWLVEGSDSARVVRGAALTNVLSLYGLPDIT